MHVARTIELLITFNTAHRQIQVNVKFFVVHINSAYNDIMGRTMLAAIQAVTSIPQFKIKFPTPNGVREVKGDLDIGRRCYNNTLISLRVRVSKHKQTMAIEMEPFTKSAIEPLALPAKETEDVELIPGNSEKFVKIGLGLQEPLQTSLVELLRVYADIFA